MIKKLFCFGVGLALLTGCAGDVKSVTLPDGSIEKQMDIQIIDDKDNYLGEDYLLRKKTSLITLGTMSTSPSKTTFKVRLERLNALQRRNNFALLPFSINGIKPISCEEGVVSESRRFSECTFDKQKVYASFVKTNRLLVDESNNGKSSASWECLKKHPRIAGFDLAKKYKWTHAVDSCIAKKYKMGSWNTLTDGSLEDRLSSRELAYTNKHYEFRIGKDTSKFKEFLFGR